MMMTCLPPPSDHPHPAGARTSYVGGVAKLTVQSALRRDEGVYVCVAKNSHGRVESSAQVQVKGQKLFCVFFYLADKVTVITF